MLESNAELPPGIVISPLNPLTGTFAPEGLPCKVEGTAGASEVPGGMVVPPVAGPVQVGAVVAAGNVVSVTVPPEFDGEAAFAAAY